MTLPLFATNPVAGAALATAFAGFAFSEYRIGLRGRPAADAQDRDRGSGRAVALGLLFAYAGGLIVSVSVPATVVTEHRIAMFVTGIAIAVAGQGFRLLAVRSLARWFTFTVYTSASQPVIDTGPYRLIRHPSYTGALTCAIGFEIAYTNWLALPMAGFLALGYLARIPTEERALVAGLGEPYREYLSRTKRLIPYVF